MRAWWVRHRAGDGPPTCIPAIIGIPGSSQEFLKSKCEAASARERRREAPEPRAEAAELRLSVASFTSEVVQ